LSPDRAATRRPVQVLLQLGLATAAVLMAAGVLAALVEGSASEGRLQVDRLFRAGLPLSERLCGLGILVLAITPAFRVIALIGLWVRERDWRYVGVALAVTAVLLAAVVVGHG
jgi:uncharacterized membrane protein